MGPRTPVFSGLRGVSLQSRHPGPGVRGLASVVPICFWSVRRSQPESWVQPSSFRCCWGGRSTEGPKPSGHHAKAAGNPPPEVATAAAEGHLGGLLENGVDVFMEQSRALEVGHGANGPRHLLALQGEWMGVAVRWGPPEHLMSSVPKPSWPF